MDDITNRDQTYNSILEDYQKLKSLEKSQGAAKLLKKQSTIFEDDKEELGTPNRKQTQDVSLLQKAMENELEKVPKLPYTKVLTENVSSHFNKLKDAGDIPDVHE